MRGRHQRLEAFIDVSPHPDSSYWVQQGEALCEDPAASASGSTQQSICCFHPVLNITMQGRLRMQVMLVAGAQGGEMHPNPKTMSPQMPRS